MTMQTCRHGYCGHRFERTDATRFECPRCGRNPEVSGNGTHYACECQCRDEVCLEACRHDVMCAACRVEAVVVTILAAPAIAAVALLDWIRGRS